MAVRTALLIVVLALSVRAQDKPPELPPALTPQSPIRIWANQIGYRPAARKIVIVASDNALPQELAIEVRASATGAAVWSLKDNPGALKPFNNGQKDAESGDFIAHLDISKLDKPGRY